MEGLIPLLIRAIKRNNTQQKYHCLSQGPAQRFHITDSYVNSHSYVTPSPEKMTKFHEEPIRHRQIKSVEEFSSRFFPPEKTGEGRHFSKEVGRAKSTRMFACIIGV
ncbi:hypothetical protein AAC387_Pa12g1510 [Persea americana]